MQCTVNHSKGIDRTKALTLFVMNNIKFDPRNAQRTILQEFENLQGFVRKIKLTVTGWQELLFPYKSFLFATAIAIATFGMYNLKLTGTLLLILFLSSLSSCKQHFFQSKLFSYLQKVNHVTNYCKICTCNVHV